MNKEIEIPEGYEARIEDNKVVLIPKESKDDRIRKAILGLTYLDGIEPILTKCSITARDIRTYLEKQKEQNSAEYIKRNSKEWHALLSEQYDKGYLRGKAEQESRMDWSDAEIQRARMILAQPTRGLV